MSASTRPVILLITALLPLAASGEETAAASGRPADIVPFEDVGMIIELNATDQDVGIQFFVDGEGWRDVQITSPDGEDIFDVQTHGRVARQGGGSELFLESAEPSLDELPLVKFFHRFPEGEYTVRGHTPNGDTFLGRAEFTHRLPAGPVIVTPQQVPGGCPHDVPIPTVISWEPVTTSYFGLPLVATEYEVIIEAERSTFDVHVPATAGDQVTVTPEALRPGTGYKFEVLAIEQGGNQTITEGCFVTAG
jgi:hypothetical protein